MPKIMGSSLAEHREEIRRRLFSALAELMAERGFDAVSLSDVAAAAGVGRTAVYNHFPDKEALLLGFIESETATFVARLDEALDGVEDPVEQFRVFVRSQATLRRDYHLAPGPELRSVVSRATSERLRDHAEAVDDILRGILALGIAVGRLPEQDLDVVVPLVNACLTSRVLGASPEAVAATEAFLLRAVGA